MKVSSLEDLQELETRWAGLDLAPNDGPVAAAAVRKFSVSDVRSVHEYSAGELDYVIPGVIVEATITMIASESGDGKTTMATAAVAAISRGVPFAGLPTARRPVLYMDRENPLQVVRERLGRLGVTDSEMFRIWGGWCETEPPSPGGAVILEWVQACEPKPVIVIDSLVAFLDGDENSSTDVEKFFKPLRALTNVGATVILIHHSGKGENAREYRGSSYIKGAIDVGYFLSRVGDPSRLDLLKMRAFKSRVTVESEMLFRYREGEFSLDSRPAYQSNEDVLRGLLVANPGMKVTDLHQLAHGVGISRKRVETFVSTAVGTGDIQLDNGSHNAKFLTWIGASE